MVSLARLASASERYAEAIAWLEKARETDQTAFGPRLVLAAVYAAMHEFDKSLAIAAEAIDINPQNARVHGILGQSYLARSDYENAADSYSRAAELDPGNAEYVLNLAKSKAMGGDRAAALEILESKTDLTMSHLPSAIAMANLKAEQGDMESAMDIAGQLSARYPENAMVRSLAAELELRRGNEEKAVRLYDEVLAMERTSRFSRRAYQIRSLVGHEDPFEPLLSFLQERPLDSNMRFYLARAYERAGDRQNAARQYEEVIGQDPGNVVAVNNLAINYAELDDDRAEVTARRAFELQPENSAILDTLGWILIQNGKLDEGIEFLRDALNARRDDPNISFHLASGLVAAGQAAEAREILQSIIARNSEFNSKAQAEALLATL
jgi:putative PEP-CTERM system TPR-repeat lipoprotein